MSVLMDEASKPSVWRSIKAVAWSFVGLRGRQGYEQDIRSINPLHLVLVGLVGVFVFVGGLIIMVNWIAAP